MLLSLGFEIPRPPRRANSCLSLSLGAFWLVRVGIKIVLIVSSSVLIRSLIFGVVLAKYVHLLDRPCVRAACG